MEYVPAESAIHDTIMCTRQIEQKCTLCVDYGTAADVASKNILSHSTSITFIVPVSKITLFLARFVASEFATVQC